MRTNRREFATALGAAAAGIAFTPARRRQVVVGGRRIRTIDIHAHCLIPEAWDLVKGYPWSGSLRTALDNPAYGRAMSLTSGEERLRVMDAWGIDVQALNINPFWYAAEREPAIELIRFQNERLAEVCAAHPDRFVAMASVALQFPDLAAQQLEHAVKSLGMRGCTIGGSVSGTELSASQLHPFWAKAEELGALVLIHPQNDVLGSQLSARLQGNGFLTNVIGNPLETTIALSHLIWEGTLDRYPGIRICGSHGGGYLASYIGRSEACLEQVASPAGCRPTKKHPREYLKQLYFDSMVFTSEELRHLVAEAGANQIMLGTDYPYGWTSRAVDHILETPGLGRGAEEAILGGTAARLLRIPA